MLDQLAKFFALATLDCSSEEHELGLEFLEALA
jgi:hypothetical protein